MSHQVIVNLIAATTTKAGLRVRAEVDPGKYPKGVKVSNKQVAAIRLKRRYGATAMGLQASPALQ